MRGSPIRPRLYLSEGGTAKTRERALKAERSKIQNKVMTMTKEKREDKGASNKEVH